MWPFMTICDHMWQYGTIWDHGGPYRTVRNHIGSYSTIQDHIWPYGTLSLLCVHMFVSEFLIHRVAHATKKYEEWAFKGFRLILCFLGSLRYFKRISVIIRDFEEFLGFLTDSKGFWEILCHFKLLNLKKIFWMFKIFIVSINLLPSSAQTSTPTLVWSWLCIIFVFSTTHPTHRLGNHPPPTHPH